MSPETDPGRADSAGQPWAGRRFDAPAQPADDGSAPPELIEAIAGFREHRLGIEAVVDAARQCRFLVPLVAHAGESGVDEHGRTVDKTQELGIVTVAGPDSRTVLPVFSSVEAMRRWDPDARPVPADGTRVALAAASENTDLVVIDPASGAELVLRRPALWAIARSQPWIPCYDDPAVRAEFEAAVAGERSVASTELAAGDPEARLAGAELVVSLALEPGLDRQQVEALVGRVQERLAASEIIAARVDSMALRILPA